MELTRATLGMMLLIGFAAACGLTIGLRLLLIETRKPYAMGSTIEAATFGVVFVVCSGFMLYLVALVTVGHVDLHAPMRLHWPTHAANAIHAGCYMMLPASRMRHRITARVAFLLQGKNAGDVLVASGRGDRDTLRRLWLYGDLQRERTTDPTRRHFRYYVTPTTANAIAVELAKHEMHVVPAVRCRMHRMEHYWRRVDTGDDPTRIPAWRMRG